MLYHVATQAWWHMCQGQWIPQLHTRCCPFFAVKCFFVWFVLFCGSTNHGCCTVYPAEYSKHSVGHWYQCWLSPCEQERQINSWYVNNPNQEELLPCLGWKEPIVTKLPLGVRWVSPEKLPCEGLSIGLCHLQFVQVAPATARSQLVVGAQAV